MLESVVLLVVIGIGVVLVSHLLEILRPEPEAPSTLRWAPDIPILYFDDGGTRVRYVKAGSGPTLVLLHTLRTQLDLFEKVIPALSEDFTVFAVDYPGHGFSDIPRANYDAEYFSDFVDRMLAGLKLSDVTLVGVSIGGAISLALAGRKNPRLSGVVAINPYDYDRGRGLARSTLLGRMIMLTSGIPIVGGTVMRLRNFLIIKSIFAGGVARPDSISPELLGEMYAVGNRRGHYRAFLTLLRRAASWEEQTNLYANIEVPVLLLWGDRDWSTPEERQHDRSLIPTAESATVTNGGHFLPLDAPTELIAHIRDFHSKRVAAK
ncbi:MAG: alpha/beta hydrolase [Gammaproteobacteria bacterium]|nr:alpha/beta hydrolase [Gammaproteobacteria bacterium]